ncbi:hypothetical protein V5O48_016237 [Marasmius crinis-equi]|uniref:Uncharacterized protein n=1 Tax=Marasmius crinis-equi TaxID=585013 RepID=A0ABR3ESC4_9AGAR
MSFDSLPKASSSSSALVLSEYFKDVQNLSIGNDTNFSTVHGSQHNYYNLHERKSRLRIIGNDEEEAEYEQFREVLRGDIVTLQDLGYDESYEWDQECLEPIKQPSERAFSSVEAIGVSRKCTLVSYVGKRAEEASVSDIIVFRLSLMLAGSYGRKTFSGFAELGEGDWQIAPGAG